MIRFSSPSGIDKNVNCNSFLKDDVEFENFIFLPFSQKLIIQKNTKITSSRFTMSLCVFIEKYINN
jgi:hypothetical protein